MLKNSRKCLTNGSKVCKIARVLSKQHKNEWDLSSAGRASALQAEGHRFEPYRSHFYGGIAQLARAHGSYPWCRGFESPSRYFFMPEILYRIECANRISCQKWHEIFLCLYVDATVVESVRMLILKYVNNAGNVINCDKNIEKCYKNVSNISKKFQKCIDKLTNMMLNRGSLLRTNGFGKGVIR